MKPIMKAKDYKEIYGEYEMLAKHYRFLFIVMVNESLGREVTNALVAEEAGMTVQGAGFLMKRYEEAGFFKNHATHPIRKDWGLDYRGIMLLDIVSGYDTEKIAAGRNRRK